MTTATKLRLPGEANTVLQYTSLSETAVDGPLVITSGKGNRLTDIDGREYIDAVNGLFNVNIGYGRPELAEVAADTMRRLSFGSSYFGRSTVEALELAEKLASITPVGIDRFMLTVGGSDANDTAIKLIRHGNILAGKPNKMMVIARRDGFHGMTIAGTTMTGIGSLRDVIGPLMPGVVHIGQPGPAGDNATAAELEAKILELGPENVAAFIAEPVSLPPGLAIPPADYWPAIRDVCTRYDVRLIADEVINGFGRTGKMFASEHWNINPDVLTLSKGITSGYLPLGAVGISDDLFQALYASDSAMPHGFTGGGHVVASAVAKANIEIIENEGLVDNAATVGEYLNSALATFAAEHSSVISTRSLGMLAGFDVDGVQITGDAATAGKAGYAILAELTKVGVLVRPYGNTIVFGPALSTTREEIDEILARIGETLERLQK
ncbi:aminotransferase family protein [Mycolicibacterium goodii]|uniref:aminotransferase family protein n=1 Tax=Mycolicibacterium goodii TaxID=134601 RepID=UPI001BDCB722|nr:aspartate aminotransferase family protein [Mycolicibacterium goodii]MBU8828916.1 aspartate aminotransferase family protein [Mycolicibacterium goodii]